MGTFQIYDVWATKIQNGSRKSMRSSETSMLLQYIPQFRIRTYVCDAGRFEREYAEKQWLCFRNLWRCTGQQRSLKPCLLSAMYPEKPVKCQKIGSGRNFGETDPVQPVWGPKVCTTANDCWQQLVAADWTLRDWIWPFTWISFELPIMAARSGKTAGCFLNIIKHALGLYPTTSQFQQQMGSFNWKLLRINAGSRCGRFVSGLLAGIWRVSDHFSWIAMWVTPVLHDPVFQKCVNPMTGFWLLIRLAAMSDDDCCGLVI